MGKENVVYIYTGEYYSVRQKDKISWFTKKKWREFIVKKKRTNSERQASWSVSHICSIGENKDNTTRRAVRQVKGDEGEARDKKGSQTGSV